MEGANVIYIHDTESEEEALVEAVLSTPPVTRVARLREAQRQSATSNTARELFGQERERSTLATNPVTWPASSRRSAPAARTDPECPLRDSSSDFESPMLPPPPRPKPYRIAARTMSWTQHSSESRTPDEGDVPASDPPASSESRAPPASTACMPTTTAASVSTTTANLGLQAASELAAASELQATAVSKSPVASVSVLATATAPAVATVSEPATTFEDTTSSAPALSHEEHGTSLQPSYAHPRWRHRPRKAARMHTLPGRHALQTHSSPDGDSDSDFSMPGKKQTAEAKGRDVSDRRHPQVMLSPMFDTRMTLVWKRDHYGHRRVPKTQDVMPDGSAQLTAPATSPRARRPLNTVAEVPPSFWSNNLIPAKWPASIARLAANYNPTDIRFPSVYPVGMCSCDSPSLGGCRYQTCENARDGNFCDVYCCPFSGNCGNGVQQSESIRLMRVVGTDELTLQATERIEQGVALGEYLGELSLETGERRDNDGFRLHYHRDYDAWGAAQVCVNARLADSLMRFLNHSCTPGAVFYELGNGHRRCIVATTVRVIEASEEITANYGDDLWFECKCFACSAKREGGRDGA